MSSGVPAAATAPPGWPASLELGFAVRGRRTVLVHERHAGPMLVQKILHPEPDGPCHAILLHPPAGIAGGDTLDLVVDAHAGARVLLTTPGATRWYRSNGRDATSEARIAVGPGAVVEYLPREAIVFNGARVRSRLDVDLAPGAATIGWDCWCLGRIAAGESYGSGELDLSVQVRCGGHLRWLERGLLGGASPLLESAAGLDGQPVFGTFWAAGRQPAPTLIERCRALPGPDQGRAALTQLPELLLARYLGRSTEAAFAWFTALWSELRPTYAAATAVAPRIWSV
ncbi:MAG: urease accessory protein UreD [Proteobacteria bacterium]|nr:urease accessory protein UreD [Pseudomonadota bacterium]